MDASSPVSAEDAAGAGAAEPDDLDFWTFVEHGLTRLRALAPAADTEAVRVTLTLSRAASVVVYDLESTAHRPEGRSWSAFRLLFVLWLAGPQESGRLAELTGTSRAAVSALTKTLERRGHVERLRRPPARRVLTLTPAGEAEVRRAQRTQNARERQWADALDVDERETLVRLLNKLLDSVAGGPRLRR